MPTERPWCFVVDSARFSRMIEGKIRHYITDAKITEGDEIIFHQDGTLRKAVFLATFVDENTYYDHDDELTIYTVALKLQEWASPDTA